MKRTFCSVLTMLLLATVFAQADVISDTSSAFAATGTQFGRLSRDGISSNWGEAKAFPGVIGAPTAYGFETFTINTGIYSYIQVSLEDPAAALFISAYLNSFNPVNSSPNFGLDTNYLGDAGLSEPLGNPSFFQIFVAPNTNLVINLNEVAPGGGAGQPFELLVEGFCSPDYGDTSTGGCTSSVPEPSSTAMLLSAGLCLIAQRLRKRRSV